MTAGSGRDFLKECDFSAFEKVSSGQKSAEPVEIIGALPSVPTARCSQTTSCKSLKSVVLRHRNNYSPVLVLRTLFGGLAEGCVIQKEDTDKRGGDRKEDNVLATNKEVPMKIFLAGATGARRKRADSDARGSRTRRHGHYAKLE